MIRLDDVLRLSRSGAIPPRSQLPIPFDEPISDAFETLSATLTFDNDVEDFLDLDNRAWTVHNEVDTRRIYYVSRSQQSLCRTSAAQSARRTDLPWQSGQPQACLASASIFMSLIIGCPTTCPPQICY